MSTALTVANASRLATSAQEGPRSILRLLHVLEHLGTAADGQTLSQLCAVLHMPKTTLFTMLKVLEQADFVVSDNGVWRLGQKAAALGALMANAPRARLPECATDALQRLSRATDETVFLALLTPDRTHCRYVAVVESQNWLRYSMPLGSEKPSYATGTGRAMLAHLPAHELEALLDQTRFERITPDTVASRRAFVAALKEVRRRGVSTVDSGTVAGVTSVAAPIFDGQGRVAAALSAGGPTARMMLRLAAIESAVREGAAEVSRLLGHQDA